jgi:hypothetical protein
MAGFESLKAADYAFTMATFEFMEKSFPAIAAKTSAIQPGEIVTAEDKSFIESNSKFLTNFADGLRKGMQEAEPPPLFRLKGSEKSAGLIPPSSASRMPM